MIYSKLPTLNPKRNIGLFLKPNYITEFNYCAFFNILSPSFISSYILPAFSLGVFSSITPYLALFCISLKNPKFYIQPISCICFLGVILKMNSPLDTTIRVRKDIKSQLAKLDFVTKEHSYNDIVLELINLYHKTKGKNEGDS